MKLKVNTMMLLKSRRASQGVWLESTRAALIRVMVMITKMIRLMFLVK
jgi:hypothetical protein